MFIFRECTSLILNLLDFCWLFRKQFTVGVLTATLDLAALVLVGVAAFFDSEVVLAPFGSLHVGGGVLELFGVYVGVVFQTILTGIEAEN